MQFQPSLYQEGAFFTLPQPITRLQIQDHWDFDRHKALLQEGDLTAGLSREGVDITVTGEVAVQDGRLLLSEAEMLAAVEELRSRLTLAVESPFLFYLYRDVEAEGESGKYFQKCTASRFQCDLSQPELFTYSLTIHADDPILYPI